MSDAPNVPPIGGESSTTAPAPKRDKFASMAARVQDDSKASTAKTGSAAAVQPQQQQRRGSKLASMVALQQQQKTTDETTENDPTQEAGTRAPSTAPSLQARRTQRDKTMRDLAQAQGWTWQLILLAEKTAKELSHVETADASIIQETSEKYLATLQNIHGTLTPHAELVVAYKNHQVDSTVAEGDNRAGVATASTEPEKETSDATLRSKNMYAARVEMRLAEERRNVLQEMLNLERQQGEKDEHQRASSDAEVDADAIDVKSQEDQEVPKAAPEKKRKR